MPQIQILGREAVEDQANRTNTALQREQMANEAMNKSLMMQHYGNQLKLEAKKQESDAKKSQMEYRANQFTAFSKVLADSKGDQNKIMLYIKMFPDMVPDTIASKDFLDAISKIQPTGEEALYQAQANALNNELGGGGQMLGIPQGQGEGNPNQPALNAMESNLPPSLIEAMQGVPAVSLEGYSPNLTITNPRQKMLNRYYETMAGEQGKAEIERGPVRGMIGNYHKQFLAAIPEIGGLSENPMEALFKGKMGEFQSNISNMPATQTLMRLVKPTALMLGSQLNKGRPTDQDAAAAEKMLMSLTFTKGVNAKLAAILSQIADYGNKDAQSELYWAMLYEAGVRKPSAVKYGKQGVEAVLNKYVGDINDGGFTITDYKE